MEWETKDKKQIGLIISYFLSRCDKKAVKALGYKNFNEAFQKLGDIINENPNNIKNMRDEFDPYFDNGQRGWYQRKLRLSRKKVFDGLKSYSDEELEIIVKKLLKMSRDEKGMKSQDILKDLRALIRQSTMHYNQDFTWQDVELTKEFKDAYEEYLEKNRWKIEYYNATSVITTPTSKNIFVPNQWFVMASYAVGVYSELHRYKNYLEKVAEEQAERMDTYVRKLRDQPHSVDKDSFIQCGNRVLQLEYSSTDRTNQAANRLWRFATDYSWWSGQKTVDRGDFYLSVVLNMLNLVNASQGYVGDIVNAYGSSPKLLALTKDLGSFTLNMEGSTYDIPIVDDEAQENEVISTEEHPISSEPRKHKISISLNSLNTLNNRKTGGQ